MRYLLFLRDHLPSPPLLIHAARRASRMCPSSLPLRVELLRALEAISAPPSQVKEAFEASLGAGYEQDEEEAGESAEDYAMVSY